MLGTPRITHSIRSERFRKGRTPTPEEAMKLIPTPKAQNANAPGEHGQGGKDLQTIISLLPTLRAEKQSPQSREDFTPNLAYRVGEKTGLKLQANFVEWMMGYPIGHTDLDH